MTGSSMVSCPSCAHDNDEFATVCGNCRAFLQNRVPNLNFFDTTWGILEAPRRTFRTVALAEHKNYGLLLYSSFGVALAFTAAWAMRLGGFFESLLDLIPVAIGSGVATGLILAFILPWIHRVTTGLLGSTMPFRQSYGVLAYSFVPLMLSLILVLPVELLTFGMYLFTSNPHPSVIKPVSYYVLLGLDVLLASWTVGLTVIGTRVVQRVSLLGSVVSAVVLLVIVAGVLAAGGWSARIMLGGTP